jgi:heptosyltransferase-2
MKILIRGTNWIGDSIMSIPAMREIRRIFPEAHVTLHTRSLSEGIFTNATFLDEIISYHRSRFAITDLYDNVSFLKEESFDISIIFPNSFESALTPFLARIPTRIGYNKDARGFLLTRPVAVPEWKNRRHEVFYYLNLVGEAERHLFGRDTVASAVPNITVEVSEARKDSVLEIQAAAGSDRSKKTVLLGVGSTNSRAKRWHAESFAKLSDRLQNELGTNVVLVGSKGDLDAAAMVTKLSSIEPVNLVGRTTMADAVAIISTADLLISNDMGLAHVAPAVGTQCITIFGPTNPITTRPYSQIATVLRRDVHCSPCMLRECPIDHRCMTGITPDAVFQAAAQSLFEDKKETYETTGDFSR